MIGIGLQLLQQLCGWKLKCVPPTAAVHNHMIQIFAWTVPFLNELAINEVSVFEDSFGEPSDERTRIP